MAMNLRGRVDGVDWHFAGNYETVVGYQPEDYATPALIRESIAVNGFRRVNSGKFPWMPRATMFVTSWATLYKPALLPGWSMVEHLPIVRGNMPFFTAFSVIFSVHRLALELSTEVSWAVISTIILLSLTSLFAPGL
ncbi:unnamed protein product [Aphanomyces euteiches]|uniref:Uncharacterized protein n=1 Tax=Aphanomyces euteiches TaxID=100861 RepID=A0A6G0X4J2_9STRA|nr:hypothetical protein Ae201684_008598 [Aphanomyces euteiches]KAH9085817.1 hypothetical protein Ae201684P_005517 [Aphanomyces euteiches]